MRTFTTLDLLRWAVLFEIAAMLVLSIAIIVFYAKRVRNPHVAGNMTWHVLAAAVGFTTVSIGVFWWVMDRIGVLEIHPSILFFLIGYAVSVVGQYFLYKRQVTHFKNENSREIPAKDINAT